MKISVICPLYNSLQYVQVTIDSLKRQTMPDFEVIFVDDCSTDGSLEAARRYTADDRRFRFIQTERNSGPGVARNLGISQAQGEYVCFIDSDDAYHEDYLSKLCDAVSGGKDIAYCQLQYVLKGEKAHVHHNPVVTAGNFGKADKCAFLRDFVTYSVCFLYRKAFLQENNLRFPELFNSEDTNFLIKTILLARTIACVDEPLYYYIVHSGSLTTVHSSRKYTERMRSMNLLMKEFSSLKHNPQHTELHLSGYNFIMNYLWLKKGLCLSIVEFIKNII